MPSFWARLTCKTSYIGFWVVSVSFWLTDRALEQWVKHLWKTNGSLSPHSLLCSSVVEPWGDSVETLSSWLWESIIVCVCVWLFECVFKSRSIALLCSRISSQKLFQDVFFSICLKVRAGWKHRASAKFTNRCSKNFYNKLWMINSYIMHIHTCLFVSSATLS